MNILLKLNTYGDYLALPMTEEALNIIEQAQVVRSAFIPRLGRDTLVVTDEPTLDLITLTSKAIHPKEYIEQLEADAEEAKAPSVVVSSEEDEGD